MNAKDDYYPFGLAYNSYQRENNVVNNYQYNGKEKQNALSLGWLDYGARMYMSDIGRWGVTDPMAGKYEAVSPYAYAFNDPVLFIDPTGRENTIYLLVAGNMDKAKAEAVMKQANAMLDQLGLKTRVVMYDEKKNGKFSEKKLEKTDNWTVIGTDRKAIVAMSKEISSDISYHKELDSWLKDDPDVVKTQKAVSPESSNNAPVGKGISVDYDDALEGRDKAEQSGLWTIHGAGHSASGVRQHLDQGVMQEGGSVLTGGLAKDYYDGGLPRVLATNPLPKYWKGNDVYVKAMIARYGNNEQHDNYGKKK